MKLKNKYGDIPYIVNNFVIEKNLELKEVKDRAINAGNIKHLAEVLDFEQKIKRTMEKLHTLFDI